MSQMRQALTAGPEQTITTILEGGKDREMWTAITLKRVAGGWRIAAIRNMLPAVPPPG